MHHGNLRGLNVDFYDSKPYLTLGRQQFVETRADGSQSEGDRPFLA